MRFTVKKFQKLSDSNTKFLRGVGFQIKFFTTRHILKQNFTTCQILFQKMFFKIRF